MQCRDDLASYKHFSRCSRAVQCRADHCEQPARQPLCLGVSAGEAGRVRRVRQGTRGAQSLCSPPRYTTSKPARVALRAPALRGRGNPYLYIQKASTCVSNTPCMQQRPSHGVAGFILACHKFSYWSAFQCPNASVRCRRLLCTCTCMSTSITSHMMFWHGCACALCRLALSTSPLCLQSSVSSSPSTLPPYWYIKDHL